MPEVVIVSAARSPIGRAVRGSRARSDTKANDLGLTCSRGSCPRQTRVLREMTGLGPSEAIPAALRNAGMSPDDIDLFEIKRSRHDRRAQHATLINCAQWRDKQVRVESMRAAGGMGVTMVIERLSWEEST